MDKNSLSSDSFMGKGDMSLRKVGSDGTGKVAIYTIRLKDMRGRQSGRMEIKALIEPIREVANKAAQKEEFSQTLGQLQISDCEVVEVRNTAMMGKQDLILKLSFPTWNSQTPLSKGAGQRASWNVKFETKRIVAAHLQRHGLKVQVVSPEMTGAETIVGEATIPVQSLIDSSNNWIDLRHALNHEGKLAGKVRLKARFTTDEIQLEEWAKLAPQDVAPKQELSTLSMNQELLQKHVSKLEAGLRAQLQQVIARSEPSGCTFNSSCALLHVGSI
jgi:hypothetical protein